MKQYRLIAMLCAVLIALSGCSAPAPTVTPAPTTQAAEETATYSKYSAAYFDTFDTVISFTAYTRTQEEFDQAAALLHDNYIYMHELYDNYNAYDGIANLYTLNASAAQAPVAVDPLLFDLLKLCKEYQPKLKGQVNVAMGSVLRIWHDYREAGLNAPENAKLPPMEDLVAASAYTNFDDVILDDEKKTVYYADPELKLDLGAVAKGYATEKVAQALYESGCTSFVISAGGNIRAGDPPRDGRKGWGVGIQNPDLAHADELTDVLYLANASVVTSGNYQRYYLVDGAIYHHLIDPDTLMPSDYFPSVTVVTKDSGVADLLSTTLFLMPYEEGVAFAQSLEGVDALWIFEDGTFTMTENLKTYAKSQGAVAR